MMATATVPTPGAADMLASPCEAGGVENYRDGKIDNPATRLSRLLDRDGDGVKDCLDLESASPVNDGVGQFDFTGTAYAALDTGNDGRLDPRDEGAIDGNDVDDRVLRSRTVNVSGCGSRLLHRQKIACLTGAQ